MSNPFVYITVKRFKNKLLSVFKKPAYIVMLLVVLALFGVTIFGGTVSSPEYYGEFEGANLFRDFSELYSIITVVYSFVFITTAFNGISKGASMFSMSDVNLIFTSPLKSTAVLIYGLIQQMGTSLLLGFFILFQYSWIHSSYGMDFGFLVTVLLGYALCAFCGQLTAMVIYSLTSSDDKKRNAIKYSLIGICIAFAIYLVYNSYINGGLNLDSLIKSACTLPISLFPVAGWVRTFIAGAQAGAGLPTIILTAGLTLLYIVAMFVMIVFFRNDFYEDVLKATEVSFSAINARKESNKVVEAVPSNIKVGATGIGKGNGSDVIYYKHKKENKRAKVFIFDTSTLVYLAITVVFSLFMKNMGIIPVIAFSAYLQLFSVALGRWTKEFSYPYIYMIPESSFKKLINCLKESFLMYFIESVIAFAIIGYIMKLDIVTIVLCILVRFAISILFTGANLFISRFFDGISIKAVTLILYFLFAMIFAMPSLIASIVIYYITFDIVFAFGTFTLVSIIVSAIVMYGCRNILDYSEYNNN